MEYENFTNIMEILFYADFNTSFLTFLDIWKDENLCEHLWNKKKNSMGIVDFWFKLDPCNKRKFYYSIKKEYDAHLEKYNTSSLF